MTLSISLRILYNKLTFPDDADDFVSTVSLWLECFIAAGLSPEEIDKKSTLFTSGICSSLRHDGVAEALMIIFIVWGAGFIYGGSARKHKLLF